MSTHFCQTKGKLFGEKRPKTALNDCVFLKKRGGLAALVILDINAVFLSFRIIQLRSCGGEMAEDIVNAIYLRLWALHVVLV